MYVNTKKIFLNAVFFIITLFFAYYFLLMTSRLSQGHSRWDYFILISFSFFYVFNLSIFWIDLNRLPLKQFIFFISISPLFTAAALIENPLKFYDYYFSPFINCFKNSGFDITSYLKYYHMDKYYSLVFQALAGIGAVKFIILIIFKKKYK